MDLFGVDLFRINLSHTNIEEFEPLFNTLRGWTDRKICLDTEGAQLRTGILAENQKDLNDGNEICLIGSINTNTDIDEGLVLNIENPGKIFHVGDILNIDFDGATVQIIEILNDNKILTRVLKGGFIESNKGIAVDRFISLPSFSQKDKEIISLSNDLGLKTVFFSFCSRGDDVVSLREMFNYDIEVISKIESRFGLINLSSICAESDAILIDRLGHFGSAAIDAKIPLFILLRGNYWLDLESSKKTLYNDKKMRTVIWFRNRIAEKCFRNATVLLPICRYLENVVKERYPNQNTSVFFEGVDSSHWYNGDKIQLTHPCVGLLQDANVWIKTKEMLVLKKVLEKMPNVNFYWAGDGPYRARILSELSKFKNFKWMGRLQYPEKVREFLSSVDVYALVSGMDNAPLTLKEAQLLEKPVVASNVGGIPEMMINEETGFLVDEGDHQGWLEELSKILNDKNLAESMGKHGKKFVQETFNWDVCAKKFLGILNSNLEK